MLPDQHKASAKTRLRFWLALAATAVASAIGVVTWSFQLKPQTPETSTVEVSSTAQPERNYRVTFEPIVNAPSLSYHDERGRRIGEAGPDTIFDLTIPGTVMDRALTPEGIDIARLVNAISTETRIVDGREKKFARVTLPYDVRPLSGRPIRGGTTVLLDLSQYATLGVVQPSGSALETGPNGQGPLATDGTTRAFDQAVPNNQLRQGPAVDTRPVPQPRVPTPEPPRNPPRPGMRFLSSPTCECVSSNRTCIRSSYFGPRRRIRTKNGRMSSGFHSGIDIAAGIGTPIIAAADGCIRRPVGRNPQSGYGLNVFIDHGGGFESHYAHMDRFEPGLQVGSCFKRGDRIGRLGETGNCTNPHLHFGLYHNRRAVDPSPYLIARSNEDFSNRSCAAVAATAGDVQTPGTSTGTATSPAGQGRTGRPNR